MIAKQLRVGDELSGSGAIIHQIFRDGLFAHNMDGSIAEPRRPFPKGKVEVWVSYPGSLGVKHDFWNARTTVSVRPSSEGDSPS